jgi:hypothetical protein
MTEQRQIPKDILNLITENLKQKYQIIIDDGEFKCFDVNSEDDLLREIIKYIYSCISNFDDEKISFHFDGNLYIISKDNLSFFSLYDQYTIVKFITCHKRHRMSTKICANGNVTNLLIYILMIRMM